jgi:hypothetical protein
MADAALLADLIHHALPLGIRHVPMSTYGTQPGLGGATSLVLGSSPGTGYRSLMSAR